MLNKVINYLLSLILVVLSCYTAWLLKGEFTIGIVLFAYIAVLSAFMPFYDVKCIRWIIDVLTIPLFLLTPIIHNLRIVVINVMGIGFFLFCVSGVIKVCGFLEITTMNDLLTVYLSLTVTFIISTQNWAGGIIDKTTNRYHAEYKGMKYQPRFAKYLIYVFYFITLLISNICTFLSTSNNIGQTAVLLASFATFVAYDRLISNKRLLEDSKLLLKASEIKDSILGNKEH